MAIFTVGPNSTYPSIAAAMAAAGPGDTIQLEADYSSETATVTHSGMIITGEASSLGIVLQLGSGIATVTLAGAAPIDLFDASDGNGIVGNDGDNVITVTAGADAVAGGLGNDRLFVDYRLATGAVTGDSTSNFAEAGGGGRLVTINGGIEHFTIWTGSGADTITTGAGDDDIRTGEGAGTVTAGEGFNTIIGGSGADTITAGSGGNYVDGGDGTNAITTGGGIDEILTGFGADTIVAGAGDDRITAVGGADTVDAGAGSDLLIIDYSTAVTAVAGGVTGGNLNGGYSGHFADLAAATLDFVGTERFWITTGSGNDTITTGDGDDIITTGAGNDGIDGGGGADAMSGGLGDDNYFADHSDDLAIEGDGEGRDIVYSSITHALAAGSEIEILSAFDNGGAAGLDLHGNEFANQIWGDAGVNLLSGAAGNDSLTAFDGDDTLLGGDGDDWLDGGAGNDALHGSAGNDTMVGAGGDDYLDGGEGADGHYGQAGNDVYLFDDSGDFAIEAAGQGRDIVYTSVSHALVAGSEIEILSAIDNNGTGALDLHGNELANELWANAGDNFLSGGGGNDALIGYGGNDLLIGGAGNDYLHGGAGADEFAFTAALGAGNVDRVVDFAQGEDKLVLDDAVFAGLAPGGLAAGAFVIGAAAQDADDRIIYDRAAGQLLFDADGNGAGAAVLFASLDGAPLISASDFVVI